jgi:hypothetical protein
MTTAIHTNASGNILSVGGLKLEDMNKILTCDLIDHKKNFRSDALLYQILFGHECLDESKNTERLNRNLSREESLWGYRPLFIKNMDKIHQMITGEKRMEDGYESTGKIMFSLSDFHSVLFSRKTLREVLCENGYFPKDISKK